MAVDKDSVERRRLERLLEEFQRESSASRPQLIHHLQLYEGGYPDLAAVASWVRVVLKWHAPNRLSHVLLSSEVYTVWKTLRRKVLHVFTGPPGADSDLSKFRDLAIQAFDASIKYIKSDNLKYNLFNFELLTPAASLTNTDRLWLLACYNLAWDEARRLNYGIEGLSLPSDKGLRASGFPRPPFGDRQEFEDWCVEGRSLPAGNHWFGLTRDVRACSAEAIQLILSLGPPPDDPQRQSLSLGSPARDPQRQSRLCAHLDRDPPFLTLDGEPIATFDETATHFVARLIGANGEGVSFAEFVRGNPRFEGAIVTRVMAGIPPDLERFIARPAKKGRLYRLKAQDLQ
jgi:hypothetical protein